LISLHFTEKFALVSVVIYDGSISLETRRN